MKNCRQFIITNEQCSDIPFGYQTTEMVYKYRKFYIHHDEKLHIQIVEDGCALLGDAFQCDRNRKAPIEELKFAFQSDEDIVDTYKTWSGRWVLIWKNQIHLDAGGMLGLFYTIKKSNYYVSSSLALIEIVTGTQKLKQAELQWNKGGLGILYH